MTPAQWHQLSNDVWLAHPDVQAIIVRNRKPIDPCASLKNALACANRGHRKRSHITRRLVMAKVKQLRKELSCQ